MAEVMRLTRAGRLDEATALIGRGLSQTGVSSGVPLRPEALRESLGGLLRDLPDALPSLSTLPGLSGLGRGMTPSVEPIAPASDLQARRFQGPAGARDYRLFVPSAPRMPAPLVVMLHGCTQTPDDFAAGTGMNALAEAQGVFVAYPAQSARANGQRCWNWFEPADQERGAGEPEIIAGITRALIGEFPIDPARVYIAGFSAGGAAAANVARAYPDLYAAVGIHSGLAAGCARDLPSALAAMRAGAPGEAMPTGLGAAAAVVVPTIVIHGEADAVVSPRNLDAVLAQAGAERLRASRETLSGGRAGRRTLYTDASGRVLAESVRIEGSGHAWSGGHAAGSYVDPDGPDASAMMLTFFARHRLGAGRA